MVGKAFLCALAVLLAAGATAAGPPERETLSYDLRHSSWNRPFGTLAVEGKEVKDGYCVGAFVKGDPRFKGMFPVDGTFETVFRKNAAMTPRRAWYTWIGHDDWRTMDCTWDGDGKAGVRVVEASGTAETTVPAADGGRDILGAVWWLRWQGYENRRAPVTANVIYRERAVPTYLRSSKKVEVEVNGERVPCIELSIERGRERLMTLWLTDDGCRTPVLFRLAVGDGTVEGTLHGYSVREVCRDPRAVESRLRPVRKAAAAGGGEGSVLPVADPWGKGARTELVKP